MPSIQAAVAEADGHIDRAIELWRGAIAATDDPGAAVDLAMTVAIALVRRTEIVRVGTLLRDLDVDRTALDPHRATKLDVLQGVTQLAASRIDDDAIRMAARYTELLDDDSTFADDVDLLAQVVAPGLALLRLHDAALDIAMRVERLAVDHSIPIVMPAVETTRGIVAFRRNFAAAAGHFEEAVSLADALGHPTLATSARNYLAVILGQLGRPETVPMADALIRSSVPNDRVAGYSALGIYWLTLGMPEKALDALMVLHEDPTIDPFVIVSRWQADLGEAAARCGDLRLAREAADQLDALSAAGGESWLIGARERVLGMIVPVDECGDHFRASVEAMEAALHVSAAARSELLWGERLRRARRRAEARQHLERARDMFQEMACGRWMERAELELVAAGVASGTSDHSRDAERILSPQQLHVARLAVAGASYKDIAAQLFVSPRTIESHLSSIYRRLGVKNRAELSALAASEPALQPVT